MIEKCALIFCLLISENISAVQIYAPREVKEGKVPRCTFFFFFFLAGQAPRSCSPVKSGPNFIMFFHILYRAGDIYSYASHFFYHHDKVALLAVVEKVAAATRVICEPDWVITRLKPLLVAASDLARRATPSKR